MNRSIWILVAACALLVTLGCGGGEDPEETPWGLIEAGENPELEGVYISGHLGNYESCPGDGYSEDSEEPSSGDMGAPPPEGDCAEDSCGGFEMNCEDAQVTVQLSNSGGDDARDLQVTKIELFDTEGNSKAVLPLMEVLETTDDYDAFDGEIEVDVEEVLRVVFQGPERPYELLRVADESGDAFGSGAAGIIEVTFESSNHDDVVIMSTEVYAIPSVDT